MTNPPTPFLWLPVQDGDPEALMLVVDTPKGTHIRCIPPALPLPAHIDHGQGAEEATHTAAATWGMPDFVFQQAEWIAVFLLDHPHVPRDTVVTWQPLGMPAIALTRRDWDFLFDQLRSTTAVLDYLSRAAGEPAVPLGDDPVRYCELAAADADAAPREIDTELVGAGGTLFSAPQLPQAPAGSDGTNVHRVLRMILEDIALTPLGEPMTELNRFTVLSDLDRLPVSA
ncbi:hypothetical protein OG749_06390 [Streptomyces nojiriensis]|uniref:hypothetical protein n=1 Tax=Streptomyces nojiriensis TaxID=66374 RepID=UPI002E16B6E7